jgi:inner membrane protein
MFNSTHTFVGFAISRTGLAKWVPHATMTAVIAANLPDIDIVAEIGSMPSYIEHHRGITHSIVGVPLLSLALAGGLYAFTRNFWRTFVVALIAMATHPALDFSNPYGYRPFLPFNGTWYYGDTVFIIDPIMDLILLLGIIGGAFFKKAKPAMAFASMAIVLLYIGERVSVRNTAKMDLDAFTSKLADHQTSAVLPRFMDLHTWEGIVGTRESFVKVNIDTRNGAVTEIARIPKMKMSPIAEKAAATPTVKTFLGFARFPITRVQATESGYRVTFLDFRFYNPDTRSSFAAEVQMDHSMRVTNETLAFNARIE